jgi:1-acyl-sn-glycerol-3-phosphate acyltransferase
MHPTYWLGYQFFRFLARGLYDFRVVGEDRLNVPGGVLIASNHASFLDPPFVGQAFDEPIHYFARHTLFSHPVAGWVLRRWQSIPINRDKPDAGSLKATIRLLRAGRKVLIFPEGTRTHDGGLQAAEAGVGLFIAKTGVPVLPVRIFGTYEAYSRQHKVLHPSSVTLVVGDLWHPDLKAAKSEGRNLYQGLANEVMDRIEQITL